MWQASGATVTAYHGFSLRACNDHTQTGDPEYQRNQARLPQTLLDGCRTQNLEQSNSIRASLTETELQAMLVRTSACFGYNEYLHRRPNCLQLLWCSLLWPIGQKTSSSARPSLANEGYLS